METMIWQHSTLALVIAYKKSITQKKWTNPNLSRKKDILFHPIEALTSKEKKKEFKKERGNPKRAISIPSSAPYKERTND